MGFVIKRHHLHDIIRYFCALRNLTNDNDLTSLGLNKSVIFRETYTPIYGWLQKCVIFEPYTRVAPSIMGHVNSKLVGSTGVHVFISVPYLLDHLGTPLRY